MILMRSAPARDAGRIGSPASGAVKNSASVLRLNPPASDTSLFLIPSIVFLVQSKAKVSGRSAENILHFAEKRAHERLVVDFGKSIEFLQKFFLALVQLPGNLHAHFDVEIAFSMSVQDRHTLVADAERRVRLRALGYFQVVLAVHCR